MLDYRRVQQYAADHPNAGRVAVGNALELPPGRVRGWLNGSRPAPVRGIQTAHAHGWIDPEPDMLDSLVELLAHVLAGGSIPAETYLPTLTPGRRVPVETLVDAIEAVGCQATVHRRADDDRPPKVTPATDGAILGRVLVAAGAPAGPKTQMSGLPEVVRLADASSRRAFAEVYAKHRAVSYSEKDTTRILEDRSQAYRHSLRDLLAAATEESVTVNECGITLSAAASRALGVDRESTNRSSSKQAPR
ncbi:hypothetical protein [Haloparvum alkalitolerans]|uniref:hypothetical protein n=1 Tax=Haloparvum alkalitolerans TaxID=1042953 RepID=UPI003CF827E8